MGGVAAPGALRVAFPPQFPPHSDCQALDARQGPAGGGWL